MQIYKIAYKVTSFSSVILLLCSCAKVSPQKPQFRHITTQEFLQANIKAQDDQDNRIKLKEEQLKRMHITGNEKTKQLINEKAAAHQDFLRKLDENKKAMIEGVTQSQ